MSNVKCQMLPHGFTLLEVVLSTAVLLVLTTVALFTFSGFNRTVDLNTVAEDITANLRRAQTRAMNADDLKCWGIHFDNPTSGSDFYSLFSDTTCTDASTAYASDTEKYFISSGSVFTTPATGNTTNVLFQKLSGARVTNSAASIVIGAADGTQSKTISINSVGLVSF